VVLGRSHVPFEEPISPLEEGMGRSSQYPDSAQTGASEPPRSGVRIIRSRRCVCAKMSAIVLSDDYGSDAVGDVLPKTP
jgi:hypothetical protein